MILFILILITNYSNIYNKFESLYYHLSFIIFILAGKIEFDLDFTEFKITIIVIINIKKNN